MKWEQTRENHLNLKQGSLLWSMQTQNDKINWTDSLFAGIMPIGIREIDHIDNR